MNRLKRTLSLTLLTLATAVPGLSCKPPSPPEIRPLSAAELLEEMARIRAESNGPILLNFWATWCVPCVRELPDLLRIRKEYAGRGLRLLLVSCDFDDQVEAARELLGRKGVDFLTYLKVGKDDPFISALDDEWEGALPATFVYDRLGNKIHSHVGQASYQELERFVEDAIEAQATDR